MYVCMYVSMCNGHDPNLYTKDKSQTKVLEIQTSSDAACICDRLWEKGPNLHFFLCQWVDLICCYVVLDKTGRRSNLPFKIKYKTRKHRLNSTSSVIDSSSHF